MRTVNREIKLNLPSKEGLRSGRNTNPLSCKQDKAMILLTMWDQILKGFILSTFRSAAADVCAKFFAKDIFR